MASRSIRRLARATTSYRVLSKTTLASKRGSDAVRRRSQSYPSLIPRPLPFASHLLFLSSKARDENWHARAGLLHKSLSNLSVSMDQNSIYSATANTSESNEILSRDFEC